jgi:NhaA family Na+:H+ antiporter
MKHLTAATRNFIASEAAGGIVLMAASALALMVANSPLAPGYFAALHAQAGPLSVHGWINDAAMALFFLLVGLEIKAEFVGGRLATWQQRRLPVIAAAAGMVVPALIFLAITADSAGLARGWAIPAATDIAFAMGLLALLGRHAPPSLKLLLTTIAIVDDMGAVAIIALAYTAHLDLLALAGAAGVLAGMAALNRFGVTRLWPYLILAVLLWVLVHASGVHATIAGVAAAMTIPMAALPRLEHALNPWVAFAIVPLFGFANAGVSFAGLSPAILLTPLPLAILAGLFLGKQIGIFASIWLTVRVRLATQPASWAQLYGMSLLAGIGFTMSLFIGGLAFAGRPELIDQVKIGVLAGSLLSALSGYALLRLAR